MYCLYNKSGNTKEEIHMAKSENQKLKLLYLQKILLEKTDDAHGITLDEMIKELERYEISSERKSIYNDLNCLRQYGMDIEKKQADKTTYYFLRSRPFQLAELKLMVDSVQSSRFITTKKSKELIQKLEGFASKYEMQQLQRQVYIADRPKTVNESIYCNVDRIHMAINENRIIEFHYFQWTVEKEMKKKRESAWYRVSPWALSWDSDNYYMIAYDSEENIIKHYRVDKMLDICITGRKREGQKCFREFNMVSYCKKLFGMFNGEEQTVTLRCHNDKAGIIIDRFGQEVNLRKIDEEHFLVNIKIAVSSQFLGWIMALGDQVMITAPEEVVERMRMEIKRLVRQYGV